MITTITMNPSLDMAYVLPHLQINEVNRVTQVAKTAGGKGLNVTRVLHLMGAEVTATGLIGGNIGRFITDQLDETGISHDFYPISGETRHSIAILHDQGDQTELLESGPEILDVEKIGFLEKLPSLLEKTAVLTMSGSLPKGLPTDFYQQLIEAAGDTPVLLDTSGKSLEASLSGTIKPFLIKPNLDEIQDLVGEKIALDDWEGLKTVLCHPLFEGVAWIVVSLGSKGAFAKYGDAFYRVEIPKIEVINPVGSGDSTLAGLAYGLDKQLAPEELLKTAMVTGMLNAQETRTGWVEMANFDELFERVKVFEV